MLRKILEFRVNEGNGGFRTLHNEKLSDVFRSLSTDQQSI
jgi:hypothetical protein